MLSGGLVHWKSHLPHCSHVLSSPLFQWSFRFINVYRIHWWLLVFSIVILMVWCGSRCCAEWIWQWRQCGYSVCSMGEWVLDVKRVGTVCIGCVDIQSVASSFCWLSPWQKEEPSIDVWISFHMSSSGLGLQGSSNIAEWNCWLGTRCLISALVPLDFLVYACVLNFLPRAIENPLWSKSQGGYRHFSGGMEDPKRRHIIHI